MSQVGWPHHREQPVAYNWVLYTLIAICISFWAVIAAAVYLLLV